jgi:hypothetical protein
MGPAGEVLFGAPDPGQPGLHARGVHGLAGVRGAGQRELLVRDGMGCGRTALHERQGLKGLERRSRIDQPVNVPERKARIAGHVANRDGAPVHAFHLGAPGEFH